MGGWASVLFFCSGRAGGRRDFVVENRVGVGGRPDTPGPVGGPVIDPDTPAPVDKIYDYSEGEHEVCASPSSISATERVDTFLILLLMGDCIQVVILQIQILFVGEPLPAMCLVMTLTLGE